MSIRLLGFIYGLVAVSITIWLESRGMKLQGQIFAWTAVAFGGDGVGYRRASTALVLGRPSDFKRDPPCRSVES